MSAKYFEYYTIILRGPFFRGHNLKHSVLHNALFINVTCMTVLTDTELVQRMLYFS